MKTYFLLETSLDFIMLVIWLNIDNGCLQTLSRKISDSIKKSFYSFAILISPLLLGILFSELQNIPEQVAHFLAIPIASATTAIGIFLVNLKLANIKQEEKIKNFAKIITSEIDAQAMMLIKLYNMALKEEGDLKISPILYKHLKNRLINEELCSLILHEGSDFPKSLIDKLIDYSNSMKDNAMYLSFLDDTSKEDFYKEDQNSKSIVKRMVTTAIENLKTSQSICKEIFKDQERVDSLAETIAKLEKLL